MQSLGLMLSDAASLLKREFEQAARPHRLTLLQWRVLAELSRDGELTQVDLAARLDTPPMSISSVVERLEAAGLLTRRVDPTDSRAKLVAITDEARALMVRMRGVADAVYAKALDGIGEDDRAATSRTLRRIAVNLGSETAIEKDPEQ